MHTVASWRRRAWSARALPLLLLCAMEGAAGGVPPFGSAPLSAWPAWEHACTLLPPKLDAGAFGVAVAMSEGRLWIGPSRDADLGEGPPQVWALGLAHGALPISVAHPRGDRSAAFGACIAAHGSAALIGAPAEGCWGVDGYDAGAAYAVALRNGAVECIRRLTAPVPQAGAAFGSAVALSEHWAIVASPRLSSTAWATGCVDVFARSATFGSFTHCTQLVSPDPQSSGWFGASVAVNDNWLAIGEPGAERVHIYRSRENRWQLHESLRAPAGAIGWYGASVALAGDVLAVGAPNAVRSQGSARGAVAVVNLADASPTQARILTPPQDGHAFGIAIALSQDAQQLVVGSSADSAIAPFAGAAWISDLRQVSRLHGPPPKDSQNWGAGVCIDGNAVAVSSAGNAELSPRPPGAVELFTQRTHLTQHTNRPRPP